MPFTVKCRFCFKKFRTGFLLRKHFDLKHHRRNLERARFQDDSGVLVEEPKAVALVNGESEYLEWLGVLVERINASLVPDHPGTQYFTRNKLGWRWKGKEGANGNRVLTDGIGLADPGDRALRSNLNYKLSLSFERLSACKQALRFIFGCHSKFLILFTYPHSQMVPCWLLSSPYEVFLPHVKSPGFSNVG